MHWDVPALEAALDALLEVDLASKGLSSDARRGAAPDDGAARARPLARRARRGLS